MVTAEWLRKRAALCSAYAAQTDDPECQQRWLRSEKMYRTLADTEEHVHSSRKDANAALR
jgi:hypothetical protein